MKVALLQMAIKEGQPDKNRQHLLELLDDDVTLNQVDLLVLPELWDTGYALADLDACADENGREAQEFLAELAKKYHINIIGGSIARAHDGRYFNTSYTFERNGQLINCYDKVHLFGLMGEDKYLSAGDSDSSFLIDDILTSQVICYDIRFPEWLRKQMAKGAKLLVVPAEWPSARISQWKILLQARAIENQAFVVAVNRTGQGLLDSFDGHSLVIDPLGNILLETDDQEGLSLFDIDFSKIEEVRGQIPVFADRRLDLYEED
ncbi:carbon-nitrogen family hydrolase [Streptococcus thoraltensis]|uniref:carbon-nitrogen family hydrolase n=1 Tax=Streptococcus thoraltensis TaxID=55085 RepID=UPI000373F311|nr:carbon-nitrogen family hydrolase [Streptococcus thoraltensis]MDY4761851.1 carbon-nitrogen family hydrolase [Streptococcus thoraltensis]